MADIGVFAYLRGLFFLYSEEIGRKDRKSKGSFLGGWPRRPFLTNSSLSAQLPDYMIDGT